MKRAVITLGHGGSRSGATLTVLRCDPKTYRIAVGTAFGNGGSNLDIKAA